MKLIIYISTSALIFFASIFSYLSLSTNNDHPKVSEKVYSSFENKHVIIFGIDGMRSDAFRTATKPNMDKLIAKGAVTYDAYAGGELGTKTQQSCVSGPGWSSILTGVWKDKHKVVNNKFTVQNFAEYPHFFSRLYEVNNNANLTSIVNYGAINSQIIRYSPNSTKFTRSSHSSSVRIKNAAVKSLDTSDPDVLFLHFSALDHDGHAKGFTTDNPAYMSQITTIDSHIGQIIKAVEARPNYKSEDWLYIVITDHGGVELKHWQQSYEERRIPMVVSGGNAVNQEVFPGLGHNSIPATVAKHLGVSVKPSWGWDASAFGFSPSGSINSKIIGCYNFDNQTNDSSPRNNNGTAQGNPSYNLGKVGMALQLDGVDDYISLGTSSDFNFGNNTDFSVSLWVKNLNGGSDDGAVIIGNKDWDSGVSKGWVIADGVKNKNSWQWNIGDNEKLLNYQGDKGSIGDNDNKWHHIAISHDRNDYTVMYLDGKLVSSVNSIKIGDITSGLQTVLGADATLNDYFLNGQIDDVSIWNRRISETEINSIYDNANSGISICESITLGVNNFDISKAKIKVYPNPSNEIIYYKSNIKFSQVIVYNTLGKEILREPYSTTNYSMDISNLSEGVYFIKFISNKQQKVVTFIKSN